jgi:hypothetical protein
MEVDITVQEKMEKAKSFMTQLKNSDTYNRRRPLAQQIKLSELHDIINGTNQDGEEDDEKGLTMMVKGKGGERE